MKSRLPAGMGGGMPNNMSGIMKQAQKMQDAMEKAREELNEREFTGTSGGGACEVIITGKKEIKSIKLSPDAVDPNDIEMLEDLLISAINETMRNIDEISAGVMENITGGMPVPML